MTSHPPRVAAWLLRTLGSGPEIEPLLGDLSEAYLAGRSRMWFWWQVLIAIPITFVDTVRAHPFLIARALGVGWLALRCANYAARKVIAFIDLVGYLEWSRINVPVYRIVEGVTQTTTVPYTTWSYLYGPALFTVVAPFATAAIASWLVARMHPGVRTAAVLTFTAMLALFWVHAHLRALTASLEPDPDIYRPAAWWITLTWFRWAPLFAELTGCVLGGLLFTHRARRRRERRGDGWSPA